MDPLDGVAPKYKGRLPRVKGGMAPCATEMLQMVTCFIDSGYVETGRCAKYTLRYEQCMATSSKSALSQTWQYRRLLKKCRLGHL